ncbi:MAG: hypothetical protein RL120_13530, partial [Gammaproteobacteria bacterium]
DPDIGLELSYGSLSGNLLGGLSFNNIQVHLPQFSAQVTGLDLEIELAQLLDSRVVLNRLNLRQPRITIHASDDEPPSVPDIDFNALPVEIHGPHITAPGLQLSVGGIDYQANTLDLAASLVGNEVRVSRLALAMEGISVSGNLSLILRDALPLAADLDYEWRRALPLDYEVASGSVVLRGDLSTLTVSNELVMPGRVSSSGTIEQLFDDSGPAFAFQHRANSLQLPVAAIAHLAASDLVVDTVSRGSDLLLSLGGNLDGELIPGIPRLAVSGEAVLSGQSLAISSIQLSRESGTATGSGSVEWANGVSVVADFALQENNPQVILPENFPSSVAALTATGSVQWRELGPGNEPELLLDIGALQARLGDYDMGGSGRIT